MLKLYRFSDEKKEYWETWDNDNGSDTVHWGELGTRGESRTVKSSDNRPQADPQRGSVPRPCTQCAEFARAWTVRYE